MLFAHPDVRAFVAATFIPAWQSVRAVPTVTIDFGGGRTLKRTVNGNIATYICRPDGTVVDILPGLSTPEAFLADLRRAAELVRLSDEELRLHHLTAPLLAAVPTGPLDASKKIGIEPRVKRALVPDAAKVEGVEPRVKRQVDAGKKLGVEPRVKRAILDDRALLEADTRSNREIRRPLIHAVLAEGTSTPAALTKRVYRDILDCDLDDPYLGLGDAAFGGGAYGPP